MESVNIICPVVLKIKVTEGFRQEMIAQINGAMQKIETQLQHLNFQAKRMVAELEKQNPAGIPAAREHLEQERSKMHEGLRALHEKLNYFVSLSIGAEIVHGTMDSITQINVGDDMRDVLATEVLICDNKVMEIRGGLK